MVRLTKGVKEESLRQELLEQQESSPPEVREWAQGAAAAAAATAGRMESSLKVFVPTEARYEYTLDCCTAICTK